MKRLMVWLSAIVLAVGMVACQPTDEEELPTIYKLAQTAELDTLVAALDAADLADLFDDPDAGPFTVFAPSEEAFAELLEALELEDLAGLIELVGAENVIAVLKFHVVGEELLAADLEDGAELDTLLVIEDVTFTLEVGIDGAVVTLFGFNSADVIDTDKMASNGVVHVIDTVLLPFDPTPEPEPEPEPDL